MTWHLRRAVEADAGRIGEITVAGWRYAYRDLLSADRLAALDPVEVAERRRASILDGPPTAVFVAENAENAENAAGARGYVLVGAAYDTGLEAPPAITPGGFNSLYLDPAVIGTGAGAALHDAGVAHLAEVGFRRATLWIFTGNDRAARFYERRGWRVDSTAITPDEWSAPATRYEREL